MMKITNFFSEDFLIYMQDIGILEEELYEVIDIFQISKYNLIKRVSIDKLFRDNFENIINDFVGSKEKISGEMELNGIRKKDTFGDVFYRNKNCIELENILIFIFTFKVVAIKKGIKSELEIKETVNELFERLSMLKNINEDLKIMLKESIDDRFYALSDYEMYILNKYFDIFKQIDDKSYSIVALFDMLSIEEQKRLIQETLNLIFQIPKSELIQEILQTVFKIPEHDKSLDNILILNKLFLIDEEQKIDIKKIKKELRIKLKNFISENKNCIVIRDINLTKRNSQCWDYLLMYKLLSSSFEKERELIKFIYENFVCNTEKEKKLSIYLMYPENFLSPAKYFKETFSDLLK